MVLELKDIIALMIGALLGVPASMAATLILGPATTIFCGFSIVKFLGLARQRLRGDPLFDGTWHQTWHVASERFAQKNPSELRVYRFLHLLAAEGENNPIKGAAYKFRMLAVIDGRYITGKWMDPQPNGYYGPFQLLISHTRDCAEGKWMGFSSKGTVKVGNWVWTKGSPD